MGSASDRGSAAPTSRSASPSASPSAAPPLLRQLNSGAVLAAVRAAAEPQRVADLAAATGLSRPTVDAVVNGLVGQGWLEPDSSLGDGRRNRGRPARRYTFRADARRVVGVDVGAHTVSAAITDLDGSTLAKGRTRTDPALPADARFRTIRSLLAALLNRAQLASSDLSCVTVGTLGVVDPVRRRVILSPGLAGWSEFDVADRLEERLGCPVLLDNDANLATEAERWRGSARGCDSVVAVLLGERMGAGIISGGTLLRGHHGAAGELGYVSSGTGESSQPGLGPLESQVNAQALVDLVRHQLRRSRRKSMLREFDASDALDTHAVANAAAAGDTIACSALDTICARLAAGIAPALLTLDPELLIIGGGMSGVGAPLKHAMETQLARLVMFPPRIELSTLGDEAVVVGAVRQSLDHVEQTVIKNIVAREAR